MAEQATPKPETSKSPLIIILAILIVALLAASAFLGYQYFQNKEKLTQQNAELKVIKDSADVLYLEYEKQIKEVETLTEEVTVYKEKNIILQAEADRYLNELETLRKQLANAQRSRTSMDSPEYGKMMESKSKAMAELQEYKNKYEQLLISYNDLETSKKQVQEQLETKAKEVTQLGNENSELTEKVNEAAKIKAFSLAIKGVRMKKNGERLDETKAKKVEKLRIEMHLQANSVARSGERDVYFIITGPGGKILKESSDQQFTYKGKQISYSTVETIIYSNDKLRVMTEVSGGGKLVAGQYEVEAFLDGEQLGVGSCTLK